MEHEDYVSYEQAQKLKELGFDWNCDFVYYLTYHNHNKPIFSRYETTRDYEMEKYWYAPTLAQTQKWLREKEIEVGVFAEFDGELRTEQWVWLMRKFNTHLYDTEFPEDISYGTYEEALSVGIDKALELLKEK